MWIFLSTLVSHSPQYKRKYRGKENIFLVLYLASSIAVCLLCALYSMCSDRAGGLVLEFEETVLVPGFANECVSMVLDHDLTWPGRVNLPSPLKPLWSHGQSTGLFSPVSLLLKLPMENLVLRMDELFLSD